MSAGSVERRSSSEVALAAAKAGWGTTCRFMLLRLADRWPQVVTALLATPIIAKLVAAALGI